MKFCVVNMKKLCILIVLSLGMISVNASELPKNQSPQENYSYCEERSMLYMLVAKIRDDEIPQKKAVIEIKKRLKSDSVKSIDDIIKIVYTDLEFRTPKWIEGYVYGLCMSVKTPSSPSPSASELKRLM